MTETSGVDLARVALRAAQAAAKTAPQPKRRTGASAPRRVPGSGGREPLSFGTAISRMVAERGWELAATGGNILEQWPAIAPTLAGNVAAVRYDLETRTLHLQSATPAHRTQLTLHQRAIIAKINQAVGPDSVRHLEILTSAALSSREYPATREPTEASERVLIDASGAADLAVELAGTTCANAGSATPFPNVATSGPAEPAEAATEAGHASSTSSSTRSATSSSAASTASSSTARSPLATTRHASPTRRPSPSHPSSSGSTPFEDTA